MLSDIEILDIMLGENHFNSRERDESLNSNLSRRPGSVISIESENGEENIHGNPRTVNPGINADFDSVTANSSAEINRLYSSLYSRISRDMDEMMTSVSVQIQRAINDAISNQVLPQIQNVIKAGSGQLTKNAWNAPSERPEVNSDVPRNSGTRNNMRSELDQDLQYGDQYSLNAHDSHTLETQYAISETAYRSFLNEASAKSSTGI